MNLVRVREVSVKTIYRGDELSAFRDYIKDGNINDLQTGAERLGTATDSANSADMLEHIYPRGKYSALYHFG